MRLLCLISLFSIFSQAYTRWEPCPSNELLKRGYSYLYKLSVRLNSKENSHLECVRVDTNGNITLLGIIYSTEYPNHLTCKLKNLSARPLVYGRLSYLPGTFLDKNRQRNDSEVDVFCNWEDQDWNIVVPSVEILYNERPILTFSNGLYKCQPNASRDKYSYEQPFYMWTCTPEGLITTDKSQFHLKDLVHCTEPILCKVVYPNEPDNMIKRAETLWSTSKALTTPAPNVEAVIVVYDDTEVQVITKCVNDTPRDIYYQWFLMDNGTITTTVGDTSNTLKLVQGESYFPIVACYTYGSGSAYRSNISQWTDPHKYLNKFISLKTLITPSEEVLLSSLLIPVFVLQLETLELIIDPIKERDNVLVVYINEDTFLLCYRSYYYNGSKPIPLEFRSSEIVNLNQYDYKALMGCDVTVITQLTKKQTTPKEVLVPTTINTTPITTITSFLHAYYSPLNEPWVVAVIVMLTIVSLMALALLGYLIYKIIQKRSKKQVKQTDQSEAFIQPDFNDKK